MRKIKRSKMVRERCRQDIIAQKVFYDYSYDDTRDIHEFMGRLKKYIGVVRAQLEHVVKTTPDVYQNSRPPVEVYGEYSIDSIENNLFHIADRFNVDFRLRWLVGALDWYQENKKG